MVWKQLKRGWRQRRGDAEHNRGLSPGGPRILVLRERGMLAGAHDDVLGWARAHRPEVAGAMELRRWPGRLPDPQRYRLFVPWLQDPVRERHPRLFEEVTRLQEQFDAADVPTINRVENLSHAIKSVGSRMLREAGLHAPRMVRIDDPAAFARDPEAAGMDYPFFVREDQKHGPPVFLMHSADDLRSVPWERLQHPVAVAYLDVQSEDGLYRKYRGVVVGDQVVPRHMVAARGWFVHAKDRVMDPAILEEERVFVESSDLPETESLLRAARHMGLDIFAADYSYDRDGRRIIWEINPIPTLWAGFNHDLKFEYQRPYVARVYEAMLTMFRERAGMGRKDRIDG